MTQVLTTVGGIDQTIPAPPLLPAALSLLDLSDELIDDAGLVAAQQESIERLASAEAAAATVIEQISNAESDADVAMLQAQKIDAIDRATQAGVWATDAAKRLADIERWTTGFVYLPELGIGALEIFVPYGGALKGTGNNQTPFGWYDPFEVIARDARSTFGWPAADQADREARATRALIAHEAFEVEKEFWNGAKIPTNYHLSASPATPTTSARRTIDGWTNPSPATGTVLGTPVGISQSLQALDQSIADADAGPGMVHATPFIVQAWMKTFPFIRLNSGQVLTVNMNVIVPGNGYPGTGPDQASRTVTDGVLTSNATVTSATAAFTDLDIGSPISDDDGEIPAGTVIVAVTNATTITISQAATASESGATLVIAGSGGRITGNRYQWAYATDRTFKCRGDVRCYPWDINQQGSPNLSSNEVEVRAERSWSILTNRLLRAAVLIDSQTA